MLSEKLLASASHDTEKEVHAHVELLREAAQLASPSLTPCRCYGKVRNLELLKKRFGDAALSACEAMLT